MCTQYQYHYHHYQQHIKTLISTMNLESALQQFCNKNLAPGMCYGGDKDNPITLPKNPNKDNPLYIKFVNFMEGDGDSGISCLTKKEIEDSGFGEQMMKQYEQEKKASNRPGKLVYQDGTACSASYSFMDVYLLDDNTYTVYTDCGHARFTGDSRHSDGVIETSHNTLAEVLDYLFTYCGHDPNTTGEMLGRIVHNYRLDLDNDMTMKYGKSRVPILAKCGDNPGLIAAILKYPKPMDL